MAKKTKPAATGYSVSDINTLNRIIPGGTGVQGVKGVLPKPKATPMPVPYSPVKGVGGNNPAPIVPTPQPEDPYLTLQRLQATNNVQLGDAESAWQQGQLQRSSGFDASGNLVTGGADFTPFSQAMQLQDAYHANQRGTTNSYAAQGQLYSGAYQNAQGIADKSYAQGYDALKTSALQGYHGIQAGRLSNYGSNAGGTGAADFQSLYKQLYPGG